MSQHQEVLPLEDLKERYNLTTPFATREVGDCMACVANKVHRKHVYEVKEEEYTGEDEGQPVHVRIDHYPDGHYEASVRKGGQVVAQYRS